MDLHPHRVAKACEFKQTDTIKHKLAYDIVQLVTSRPDPCQDREAYDCAALQCLIMMASLNEVAFVSIGS